MATLIKIKRSETSGNPSTLGAGELAYSALADNGTNGGDRLYIGMGTETNGDAVNHIVIGGKYFTDKLDHSPGTLTASSSIIVDANSKIDDLKVDNLELNGNTLSSTDNDGNILLDPIGTGYVQVIGTNGFVIPSGTTAERAPAVNGAIRLNTSTYQFEGYANSQWISMGGVRSVDGLTYITAETTPGTSDDVLSFYVDSVKQLSLDVDSFDVSTTVGTVNINATTESTNTTTGALVVDGGVGIAGALNVGGTMNITGGTTYTGDIAVNGGDITTTSETASVFNTTATTVNAFGAATALELGATTGTTSINNALTVDGSTTIGSVVTPVATTIHATTLSSTGNASSSFSVVSDSETDTTLTIDSTNAGTGNALINIGGATTDKTTLTATEVETNVTTFDLNATTIDITTTGTGDSVSITTELIAVKTPTLNITGESGSGTAATVSVEGQLNVDNVRIDGNTISTTDVSNTIYIDPSPTGSEGLVVIEGNLQVNGTTTTVNSTQVTIDDPIFTLGGDTDPTSDDNLDRGILYRWYDPTPVTGGARLGFFGWDDSADEFVFIANASDSSSVISPAVAGVYGNAKFGKLAVTDATDSSTTQTGALVITGGVGIGKKLYVGTNIVGSGVTTSSIDGFLLDGGTY